MTSEGWNLALSHQEQRRLRHELERRIADVDASATWSSTALVSLLEALIRDLGIGWSGIEVLDTRIETPEAFVVLYRAVYLDGPLAIRGSKALRGAYLTGADTPEMFGGYFALYLEEPSGTESFTPPDENGVRWFINVREGSG